MSIRAKLHPAPNRELTEAALYLDRERAGYGDRFLTAFDTGCDFLLQYPNSGRPSRFGARSWDITGFHYDIVYVIRGELIFIVAIAHHRRRPEYWRSRLR